MIDNLKNYIKLYKCDNCDLKDAINKKIKQPEHYIVDLDTNNIYNVETFNDYHTEENYNLIHEKDNARVTRLLNFIDRKKLLKFNNTSTMDYGQVLVINKKNTKQEINLMSNTFTDLVRIIK